MDITRALPLIEATKAPDETGPTTAFAEDDAVVSRAWTCGMSVHYVVEDQGTLCFVRWRDLGDRDPDGLHASAISNLIARANRTLGWRTEGDVVRVELDGKLDASTLLLDAPWDDVARTIDPPLVATLAASDLVAVTSASSESGLARIRALRDAVPAHDRLLPHTLLVRRGRDWVSFG